MKRFASFHVPQEYRNEKANFNLIQGFYELTDVVKTSSRAPGVGNLDEFREEVAELILASNHCYEVPEEYVNENI